MTWQAIKSSTEGVKHLAGEIPCQDYSSFKRLAEGNVIIGAISDGMGSAKHSRLGSELAVKVAISELEQIYRSSEQKEFNQYVEDVFNSVLDTVRLALNDQAYKNSCSVQDLACTLIAFIATPDQLIAMQIGDGLLVVRTEGGNYELLFKPDKGEFANETTSVTSSNARHAMKVDQKQFCQFICAATDGIENISLIKSEGWKPSFNFFEPLEQHILSEGTEEQKEEKLKSFLSSERINQSTDDDKTILLCAYQNGSSQEEQVEQAYDNLENKLTLADNRAYKSFRSHTGSKISLINSNSNQGKTKEHCSSSEDRALISQPFEAKRLSEQDFKLIKSEIIKAFNLSPILIVKQKTRVRHLIKSPDMPIFSLKQIIIHTLKQRDNPKQDCLEIWIPSNQKIICRVRIVKEIRRILINLNSPYIKRVKIVNYFAGERGIIYWTESFNTRKSINFLIIFLLTALILGFILVIFHISPQIAAFVFSL